MPNSIVEARTEQGYWVKVKDGEVLQVWNTQPDQDELDSGLWTPAVEIFPEYIPGREEISGHTIDITENPIEIVYGKISIEVSSRVDNAIYGLQRKYKQVVLEEGEKPLDGAGDVDVARITAAKTLLDQKVTALSAITTHDDFDDFDLTFSV